MDNSKLSHTRLTRSTHEQYILTHGPHMVSTLSQVISHDSHDSHTVSTRPGHMVSHIITSYLARLTHDSHMIGSHGQHTVIVVSGDRLNLLTIGR